MHVLSLFRDEVDYQVAIFAADEWRAAEIWEAIAKRFWLMPDGWLGSEVDSWLVLVARSMDGRRVCGASRTLVSIARSMANHLADRLPSNRSPGT